MSQNDEDWVSPQEQANDAKNSELENLRRLANTFDYLAKKRPSVNNLKQAIKSVLSHQVQIELAFQSAKLDVIYTNAKSNSALQVDSSFSDIERNFKKLRNINVIIELCRACGMFQFEEIFLNALIQREFESENKQNSLVSTMEKMMVKTLNEYVQKLNKAELAIKREKNG